MNDSLDPRGSSTSAGGNVVDFALTRFVVTFVVAALSGAIIFVLL